MEIAVKKRYRQFYVGFRAVETETGISFQRFWHIPPVDKKDNRIISPWDKESLKIGIKILEQCIAHMKLDEENDQ